MNVLAIDPGPKQSAFVTWDGAKVHTTGIISNGELIAAVGTQQTCETVAIEMIQSFGMAVGAEVFETCLWIGRFCERSPIEPRLIYRRDVKLHHCGNVRAKDTNIRQALIDKYGAVGTKNNPGKLYGIKSHLWSALAIATMITEQANERRAAA